MKAKVPTGRASVVRPPEVLCFDETYARLGAIAGTVLKSSAVLGLTAA